MNLDDLLVKATKSLEESQISFQNLNFSSSIQQDSKLYFESSLKKTKGLILLKKDLPSTSPPKPTQTSTFTNSKKSKSLKTAGPDWFNMPAMEITDELKKDLHVLKSRNVLDPKRHYRKEKLGNSPFIQIGTVIQGPTEYYSSRLVRKDRRENIVQELLADADAKSYFKKKYLEIQDKKSRFTKRKAFKRRGRRS